MLANLPYVAQDAPLAPEIAGYEPAGALFCGPDGLDLIRRLIAQVGGRSPRPAMVALEIGPEQAPVVAALLREAGYARVSVHRDLAGHDRVVAGTVPAR